MLCRFGNYSYLCTVTSYHVMFDINIIVLMI